MAVWLYQTSWFGLLVVDGLAPLSAWLLVTVFWCLGTLICVWYLRQLVTPLRAESVILGQHEFRYDPGNIDAVLLRFGMLMFFFVSFSYRGRSAMRSVRIPKAELQFEITDDVWRSRGRRLILCHNGREIEIGSWLTDSQRMELHQKIQEWRQQASD